MKNVFSSNFVADGTTTIFPAYGLNTVDPAYCLVTLGKYTLTHGTDYSILPNFNINFVTAPPASVGIAIYVFEAATNTLPHKKEDNITHITRTNYVSDGTTNIFYANGNLTANNNCLVIAGAGASRSGFVYQFNKDYTIAGNNIIFNSIPPARISVQILVFDTNIPSITGGVSEYNHTDLITRADVVADGTSRVYSVPGRTESNSLYCMVAYNGRMLEGGVDYIISHSRVKFIKAIPPANTKLTFIVFNPAAPALIPPSPIDRVKYLNKATNLNERTLYKNYWREQIRHYGMTVNYYLNKTTKDNADIIYGESSIAGYTEPEKLNIAIKIDNESSMFTKFGLSSDTDATCYIHHEDFQEVFGAGSEPKIGDLIEFIEIGEDRLNYPKRGPRIMEITMKNDEIPSEINNLAGHYVWQVNLKRFDYSRENSILPELGTIPATDTGETVPGVDNPVEVLSKEIFDYTVHPCSNDNVYGDY